MDTLQAIKEALNTRLTTDGTLMGMFPGGAVKCFNRWAEQDASFPYIVVTLGNDADEWMEQGSVVVNVWDKGSEEDRCLNIHGRVRQLFYDYAFTTGAGEVGAARLGRPRSQPIDDPEPDVWRWEITFPIRFFDKQGVWA